MADQRVDIKIKAGLEVDASDMERTIAGIPNRVREAAENSIKAPPGTTTQPSHVDNFELYTRARQQVDAIRGAEGSYLENKKKLIAAYKEQVAQVRRLEEAHHRLKSTEHGQSKEFMKAREYEIQDGRYYVNRMRDIIAVGTAEEAMLGGTTRGGLFGMSAQQAMNGGIIGAGAGMIGRAVMAHPILAGAAAVAGGANWLLNRADDASQYSDTIDIGFSNTGRRAGMGRGLRGLFQSGRRGTTDSEFMRLGYTGEALTKMADAYGMPSSSGAFRSAIQAQGLFARAYGFGENPDAIAAAGRRSTQLGIAESGQQTQFWRSMTAAVEQGMKNGVDASETMRSMMGLSEQAASRLGVISADYKNGLMGVQALLSTSDSRFFKGERGAQQVGSLLDAFQEPQSIAHERFLMNAIMASHGGRVPTAQELGLTGAHAGAYDKMTEFQKLRVAMKNPQDLSTRAGFMAKDFGPDNEMLGLQAMTGKDGVELMELAASLSSTFEKKHGKKRAKELYGRPFTMLSEMGGDLDKEIERMRRGKKADGTLTGVEDLRAQQTAVKEAFSTEIADATHWLRLFKTETELATQRLAILGVTEVGNAIRNSNTEKLAERFPPAALAAELLKRAMHGKSAFGSSGSK